MAKLDYDDAWLLSHASQCYGMGGWKRLWADYNADHGTDINYHTLKSHCIKELNFKTGFSPEEDAIITEMYPDFDSTVIADTLLQLFGRKRSHRSIAIHARRKLGLHKTEEYWQQAAIRKTGRIRQVGEEGTGANGEVYVKLASGKFVPRKYLVTGKPPKGMVVVHLNGDNTDDAPENLAVSEKGTTILMAHNGFWSESSEVTRTGIAWCELYKALKSE